MSADEKAREMEIAPKRSLLKPAGSTGRLFAGFYGAEGTGKTTTAVHLALAWRQAAELTGPIVFVDTERGAHWHRATVKQATGQDMLTLETRKLDELLPAFAEAKQLGAAVVIVDSLTHFLRELREQYFTKRNIEDPQPQHYVAADKPFKELLDKMLKASSNLVCCGREGQVYGLVENKSGKKGQAPIDTKMDAGKAGYEFDLLFHMERHAVKGGDAYRTCTVRKDRSQLVDGEVWRVPFKWSEKAAALFSRLKGGE